MTPVPIIITLIVVLPCCFAHYLDFNNNNDVFQMHKDTSSTLDDVWESYKSYHQKVYSPKENQYRRAIWEKNVAKIQRHNLEHNLGQHTYSMGVSQLTDWTYSEYKTMLGFKSDYQIKESMYQTPLRRTNVTLPDTVDWRTKGYVTPVKNQIMAESSENPLVDIEDIFDGNDTIPSRNKGRQHVVPKAKRKKRQPDEETNGFPEPVCAESIIPGTQKVYVKTWGCSHNNSDGEYMAGQLASYGYNVIEDKDTADLWLLNSCTVKAPAEDHFRNEINKGRKNGKHVVLAGCVPQGQPRADYMQGLSVIGVQQIDRVVEVVEETLKGHTVRLFGQKKVDGKKAGGADLSLPKIRKNPLIEIIAINTGCLNQCTYCKTKHARGELGSYSIEDICARARQSFEEGVVEIWLTSEDLGAYGHDIGVTLPQLLWKLVETIPEGAMMRLGMTNPPYILEHLEEMAKILKHPRVYSFLHVPVQSGSDSVLMDMKREYCQADFRHVVDFLKARVPDVTIATDVICGFPTETPEDFEDTLQLVRDYKFPSLFINQFFPRPGTPAAKMQRVPAQEVKVRTREISDLFQSYVPYDHKMGLRQKVLVTETSHDQQYYVAHNKAYDQVLVPKEEDLMGKMIEVDIYETGKHYLKGKVVKEGEVKRPEAVPPPEKKGVVTGVRFNVPPEKPAPSEHPLWVKVTIGAVAAAVVARITLFAIKYSRTSAN